MYFLAENTQRHTKNTIHMLYTANVLLGGSVVERGVGIQEGLGSDPKERHPV